jgi:hypothetical protein
MPRASWKLPALLGTSVVVGLMAMGQEKSRSGPELTPPRPTLQHKLLKDDEGAWDATVRIWPGSDKEPIEAKAVEINRMMPGGLWLIQNTFSRDEEHPYHGHGLVGYDPHKGKYIATWADNMSPSLTMMEGSYDDATATATFTGTSGDAQGKPIRVEVVDVYKDDDHHTATIHLLPAEGTKGEKVKVMEIGYRRMAPPEAIKAGFEQLKQEFEKKKFDFEKKKFEFFKKKRDAEKDRDDDDVKKLDYER